MARERIDVSYFQGNKMFGLYPFDAYIGEIYGWGQKHGYYIQLSRGTQDLNKDVAKTTFARKGDAEKVIRKWIRARRTQYDLEQMRGG